MIRIFTITSVYVVGIIHEFGGSLINWLLRVYFFNCLKKKVWMRRPILIMVFANHEMIINFEQFWSSPAFFKVINAGLGCSSVVKLLPNMFQALGLVPKANQKKKKTQKNVPNVLSWGRTWNGLGQYRIAKHVYRGSGWGWLSESHNSPLTKNSQMRNTRKEPTASWREWLASSWNVGSCC
jgi:hypothetical protein